VRLPRRAAARPLATQRLAAALVAGSHGLDGAHIGSICDALTAAGIDPTVWTARDITDALNADMRARGWTWPDHITNPGAFLFSRLRRLDWSPPKTPTKVGGCAADSIEQKTPPLVPLTAAARTRIAAAQEQIRHILANRSQHIHSDAPNPVNPPVRNPLSSRPAGPRLQRDLAGRPRDVDDEVLVLHRLALDEPAHHPLCPAPSLATSTSSNPDSTTNAPRPI